MKELWKILAVAACLCGCREAVEDLDARVKREMQEKLATGDVMKDLVIKEVRLVNKSGNDYVGDAVADVGGHFIKYNVKCTYDGRHALWDASLSSDSDLTFLAKEKVKSVWAGVKKGLNEACDKAAEKASEVSDKISSAVDKAVSSEKSE